MFSSHYGKWLHVVGTYNGTDQKLYFNGVEVSSNADTWTNKGAATNEIHVGAGIGTNNTALKYGLDGQIANLQIYNRVLSQAEITQNYQCPKEQIRIMGASAGPSLVGIGRGGDSNLVLEMDAHDAKSYPGEPTENLLSSSAMDFSVLSAYTGSTFTRVADGESPTGYACEMYYTGTVNTSARCLFGTNNGNMPTSGSAFVSVWVKRTAGPSTLMRPAYFAGNSWHVMPPLDGGSAYMTSEYRPFGYNGTVGTGSGGPNPGFSMTNGGNSTSSDKTRWIMPQFTTKTYATPFVREGNGGAGTYNARPASTNLMIHGNVGTGQSFSDSSPSKHTITAYGDATHSSESKFSGGSIAFDGTLNDYLGVADSTDWEFSNGVFTIDFWYKNNSTATNRGVISIAHSSQSNYENILVFTAGSGTTLVLYSSSGGTSWDIASGVAMGAFGSDWTHYAIVRAAVDGDITLYNNGTLQTTVSTSATLRAVDTFRIGQRVSESNGASCYLDEIRITKGTALWSSDFTPPTRRNLNAPVVDRSGNDNGGNFATTATTDVTNYRVGEVIRPIGSAVWDFDGTDDLTTIGYHNSLNTPNAATFSVWLYPEANGEFLNRGTSDSGTDPDNPRFYVYWNLQKFYFDWSETGSDQYVTTAAGGFPANTWVNVVATVVAGGRMEIYINGGVASYETRANADSMANPLPNTNDPIQLGGATWIPRYFAGKIASVGIYDVALTPQQIVENFNQQRSRFKI